MELSMYTLMHLIEIALLAYIAVMVTVVWMGRARQAA
jgi:hypothetical protein